MRRSEAITEKGEVILRYPPNLPAGYTPQGQCACPLEVNKHPKLVRYCLHCCPGLKTYLWLPHEFIPSLLKPSLSCWDLVRDLFWPLGTQHPLVQPNPSLKLCDS